MVALAAVALVALAAACAHDGSEDTQPDNTPRLEETKRLAGLCEAWGFLKYYHPQVAQRGDWDATLISFVPRVRAAETQGAFNDEILALLTQAGSLDASPFSGALATALRWIDDRELFLPETSRQLRIVVAAHRPGANLYVAPAAANNPDFSGDQGNGWAAPSSDAATRLLTLFRFWNMVQYFFPYKDVMDRDWLLVLYDLLPKFLGAQGALEYHLAVAEMTASINDAHAGTYSNVLYSYFGANCVPADVRLVENRTVITRVFPRLLDAAAALRVGDVVTQIDGVPPETKRATLRPLLAGSNAASLEKNVHDCLLRTNAARVSLVVQGQDGRTSTVDANAVTLSSLWNERSATGGEVSSILAGDVGYVHLGRLQVADVDGVMARLRNTRGIVFDLRNYPNGTLGVLSSYLNATPLPFAKFLLPDFDHPGSFYWSEVINAGAGTWGSPPAPFVYAGRVAVLVDQETLSQAEYTTMALRTAPGATVVGSQTAGADGNVSQVSLPGGIATGFSGIGVFYPDGTPTQRVGIVPDVEVKPTIQGLRQGRDEVLEAALAILR